MFESILFERAPGAGTTDALDEPDYFADLNLDQVVASMTAGRDRYELKPFFYAPLHEVSAVRYRHEVLRDLERPEVLESITTFAGTMARMRDGLLAVASLRHRLQRQLWLVDVVATYSEAVRSLEAGLTQSDVASRGLRGLRDYLADYVASERFTALVAETESVSGRIAAVRYVVRIQGARVTVAGYAGQSDYSAEVLETFAKFQQGAAASYLVALPDYPETNHVEEQILDRVALLHPDLFGTLAEYTKHRRGFLDATIERFDREVQFYVAYLDLIAPLKAKGLAFCYPLVSARSKEVVAEETFDIALATKLLAEGGAVVCNDFQLVGAERVFVVTGPNNGGKTTFARMFGQLHHLAGLGLPVPGRSARLFLPDRVYTHFEREEDIQTLRGKFEDELVRVHEILERASPNSVIVMNESFGSTTVDDALFVGGEVMRRIVELGPLAVYVTFVDELASLSEATVSMVAQIDPDDAAERTFKVLRRPADGLAYAWAIAEKYGLTYGRLMDRVRA